MNVGSPIDAGRAESGSVARIPLRCIQATLLPHGALIAASLEEA